MLIAVGGNPSANHTIAICLCTNLHWLGHSGWLGAVPVLMHQFTTSFVAAAGWSPSAGAPIYRLLGHSGWVHSQCSTLIANCQQHSMVNYARERGLPLTLKVDVRTANMGLQYGG